MNLKGKYFKRVYKDNYVIVKGIFDIDYPSPIAKTTCKIVFESVPWGTSCVGLKAEFAIDMLIPMTEEEVMLEIL